MLMYFKCMLTGALLTRISKPPKNLGSRRFRGGTYIQGHVPHTQDLGAAKTNKVILTWAFHVFGSSFNVKPATAIQLEFKSIMYK